MRALHFRHRSTIIERVESFPIQDIIEAREDVRLQGAHREEVALIRDGQEATTRCPECNATGTDLTWFYFTSPPWTWEHLCGRSGVIAFCDRDQAQVGKSITTMN